MRAIRLGNEEKSRCLFVETMNDAGATFLWSRRERPTATLERIDQRSRPVAGRGVHHHPRRLVDRKKLVVVGSSRVDLQACKLEYSIVSPK